ncbi:molecular chaperone HtpG [Pseudonocardia sp.]|jgi:molecular chaperone HtpG|uniref:molecular chaperone HtpG n=1 Tax=Pseudonocardia sp. TaxID=60912 RepID=UPI00263646E1|nr:molecular chaperone HtpG [Pseudonocardia sp.]MCW2718501.1 molecular chaperone HtpG [Pseudonocardia sp.]MDT7616506.1 molecular chaperone HtpG [Pseudonocardiales bacterium]
MAVETIEFQAEAKQLLQLMIHSIYSNRDVFLRELVSNASDALDKLRLETYRDKDLQADVTDLHVEIEADPEHRTLTVRDNGIGMSRDEVVSLIGTIAKSGTAELLSTLRAAADAQESGAAAELIGKFGIGFYSSFMVGDSVTLVTRRAGAGSGVRWESAGEGTYTIEDVADAPQGTAVTVALKPADADDAMPDYTDPSTIRRIVERYSDFITWPIRTTPPGAEEPVTLNRMKALWARPRSEVTDEEYAEFYRHVSHDWREPLETIRLQAEGAFEYQALLFLPSHAPMDLFLRERRRGVQLYVRRVFIMDDCEALVPEYLRFVKGVVDAADLSLNVSREIVAQDRQIQLIRKRLVRKVLSTIKDMRSANPERYATFWAEMGRAVKEGLLEDPDNRDQILEICSFPSTHDDAEPTTLAAYKERMPEGQEQIYYMTGESRTAIENSPHMEALRAKGHEVLLLTDPIDEVWVDSVPEFDGTPMTSIAKGQAVTEEEVADAGRFTGLLSWMGEVLADEVREVRLTSRLTTSPACLVGDSGDMTPTLEKMYRAMGQEMPRIKRILELNPEHPLVVALRTAHEQRPDDDAAADTARLLHDMALLAEGGDLTDPARFVGLLADRLQHSL